MFKYLLSSLFVFWLSGFSWAEPDISAETLHQRVSERAQTANITGLAYAVIIDGTTFN